MNQGKGYYIINGPALTSPCNISRIRVTFRSHYPSLPRLAGAPAKPLPESSATEQLEVQLPEPIAQSETEASDSSSNTDPYTHTLVPLSDTAEHGPTSKDHVRSDHPK